MVYFAQSVEIMNKQHALYVYSNHSSQENQRNCNEKYVNVWNSIILTDGYYLPQLDDCQWRKFYKYPTTHSLFNIKVAKYDIL